MAQVYIDSKLWSQNCNCKPDSYLTHRNVLASHWNPWRERWKVQAVFSSEILSFCLTRTSYKFWFFTSYVRNNREKLLSSKVMTKWTAKKIVITKKSIQTRDCKKKRKICALPDSFNKYVTVYLQALSYCWWVVGKK